MDQDDFEFVDRWQALRENQAVVNTCEARRKADAADDKEKN